MDEMKIKVETLQNLLVEVATGGARDEKVEKTFQEFRSAVLSNDEIKKVLPDFIQTNRSVAQFWQFIKAKYPSYQERRAYLWEQFSPAIEFLESRQKGIAQQTNTSKIEKFNQDYINREWNKAMERLPSDPEGAITSARTLLETTCKFVLDSLNVQYKDDVDLPKLYRLTADQLNLAPDQHTEQIFKQILGGCHSIVDGLGALRNKLSDSHGKKVTQSKPSARHAHLAVNLSGTMTTFLLESFDAKAK